MSKQIVKESLSPQEKKRDEIIIAEDSILAESAGIDGSHWQLCIQLLNRKSPEWKVLQELAENAGGVNPFYEPSFLLALRGKMIRSSEHHFILYEKVGNTKRAKLAFPVFQNRTFKGQKYFKAFENEYTPLATPLMDLRDSEETMLRFCELLNEAVGEHKLTLRVETVCTDSEFSRLIKKSIKDGKFNDKVSVKENELFSRAGLYPAVGEKGGLSSLGKKRIRELARLEKKIAEIGKVQFESVTEKMDILLRFEEFLLLEMKGWKGKKGTSMQLLKKTSAFARLAVTELADQGKAEIFSLRLDNRSIATIIIFKIDGRYYPWKIAFDEDYAHRSPGSILIYAMSKAILNRPDYKMADSLAKPGKSWISSVWRDELQFSEFIIGPDDSLVENISNSGTLKTKAKQFIKHILKLK